MEQKPQSFFEKTGKWLKTSVSVRIVTIGILILFLLIPVSMVESLIRERSYRQEEAVTEVSSKWGEKQTVTGPVISVPYKTFTKVYEEKSSVYKLVESVSYAHFLPDELVINAGAEPEERYRGIYRVIVYNARVKLSGKFLYPNVELLGIEQGNVLWNDAFISVGLTDLRSIQENIAVNVNGETLSFNPGVETNDVIAGGISAPFKIASKSPQDTLLAFEMEMNFNGSSELNFTPMGKETTVSMQSPWKDPSFDGAFLPDSRSITNDGFTAQWRVLHLNRPYPQRFTGPAQGISESAFGVSLIVPVDEYQKSTRSAKYAVMFITLTFLLFFFAQVLYKVRVHPVQYLMIGLALCVFYILLIALSEHISFLYSYLVASTAIIGLITYYAGSIFSNKTLTRMVLLVLIILYLFIYSVIQLEDYALLMGSAGLFVVLTLVMVLSRKIDWYGVGEQNEKSEK